ncbi:hypothetical protein KM043_014732 [Ampulex compressa]|nr:hypothetical protein KM043_014732 [Ampulex compressa]
MKSASQMNVTNDIQNNVNKMLKKKRKRDIKSGEDCSDTKLDSHIVDDEDKSVLLHNGAVKKKRKIKGNGEAMPIISDKQHSMECETESNGNVMQEKSSKTEPGNFNAKRFRKSLNLANNLDELKKFIEVCNEKNGKDIAAEYILAGGSVLEILRLLDSTEKTNSIVIPVFSAIRILLIKILAEYPRYLTSAEEACQHLINSHMAWIHSMLSVQSTTKQRKVVLQLLAAIVSLGSNLPRELLAHLSLQPQVLESLVRHVKPTDTQSVRICYIHFILAFLVDGNASVIRALLDKRGLLSSIFPDLMYDPKDIIGLVLITIKTYILENSGINKTTKLHVFSTSVVQNLVSLYNWKGPTNWSKNKTASSASHPEYLKEKEAVNEILHQFLITLLTSHRHGIIFHDRTLGTSHVKHNQLVSTVLHSLDRPWEYAKPSDLVIRVTVACPDLIKPQITLLEPYLEPRISSKWITLMKFITRMIEAVDVDNCLKICSPILSLSHLANAIMSLTLSNVILKKVIVPALNHESTIVKHEAVILLTSMLNQVKKFVLVTPKIFGDNINFNEFKCNVTGYVVKNVPSLDLILNAWNQVFAPSESVNNTLGNDNVLSPKDEEHLDAILNLLHSYSDVCPELLDSILHVQTSVLLSKMNELRNVDIDMLNTLKVKAIQFLFALDPTQFTPKKKIFSEALSFLLSLLNGQFAEVSLYANRTVKAILNVSGVFEGCSDQIDIWIHSFFNLTHVDNGKEMIDWFLSIVKNAFRHADEYIDIIIEAEQTADDNSGNYNKFDYNINELIIKDSTDISMDNDNEFYIQQSTSVPPLLCSMIQKLSNKSNPTFLSYASYVLIQTLHYQVTPSDVKKLFLPLKNKLFSELNEMIQKNERSKKNVDTRIATSFLELLQFTVQDVVHLLCKFEKLQNNMFLSKDESSLSVYGHILPKLLEIATAKEMKPHRAVLFKLDTQCVTRFYTILLYLKSFDALDLYEWETALWKFLCAFPHNISSISSDEFISLLAKRKPTTSTTKLISLLVGRNTKLIPLFVRYIKKSEDIRKSDVVFPIMSSNLRYKWDQDFLGTLNQHYQEDILSYLCNPENLKTWIEENEQAIIYLIQNTFDLKICKDACDAISQIGDKLEMVPTYYVRILQTLYKRYGALVKDDDSPVRELIQVLIHIMMLTLKKESKNTEKLNVLCDELNITISDLRESKKDFVFESLRNHYSWSQFTRFSLKLVLKDSKTEATQLKILKTLNMLCNIAYADNSDHEYVKTLFEMATSHSEFVNIMLGTSVVKRYLIELLWILMRKNKNVMALTHVPLYLAAYNATLSEADQLILLILQYYENNNIQIHKYRPYLWGNAAASHYSVKSEMDMALFRQPTTTKVLNLLDKKIVSNTIQHYPINRPLQSTNLHSASNMYDPAFYLPLLCYLLSENNVVACHKITQSGALALALVACCSEHSDVRMAAYTTISRYYAHLEASSSKERLLWMRLIDALRCGIISTNSELSNLRLSCIVSTFLAQTTLVAVHPLHPLYSRLQSFLMAKPALDIKTIPEVLQLLHSSDVEHKAHRYWILEIIRDGIKTMYDVEIAFKCVLFKMLLDFYTCTLSDERTKVLILEVIEATSRISKASVLLVSEYSLLPWLSEVVGHSVCEQIHFVELLVNIVNNLYNALTQRKADMLHYNALLLRIVLNIESYLTKDTDVAIFGLYISVFQKLLAYKHSTLIVKRENMCRLLELSKDILQDVDDCEDMFYHDCEYAQDIDRVETEREIIKEDLKAIVRAWRSRKT